MGNDLTEGSKRKKHSEKYTENLSKRESRVVTRNCHSSIWGFKGGNRDTSFRKEEGRRQKEKVWVGGGEGSKRKGKSISRRHFWERWEKVCGVMGN